MTQTPFLVDQSLLRDPLGETARRERRGLLAVSLLAIAIVKGQMMPAKLVLADIALSTQNQQFLLWLLLWVVLYFVAAFSLYAFSDYGLWGFDFSAARFAQRQAAWEGLRSLAREVESGRDPNALPYPLPGSPIAGPPLPTELAQQVADTPPGPPLKRRAGLARMAFAVRLVVDIILPLVIGAYAVSLLSCGNWTFRP